MEIVPDGSNGKSTMYTTGNHIADGDYDAHAAIVSAHWASEEQSGYDSVMAYWGDTSDIEPGEEKERIDALLYERKRTHCDGKRRAYDEIINQIKTKG